MFRGIPFFSIPHWFVGKVTSKTKFIQFEYRRKFNNKIFPLTCIYSIGSAHDVTSITDNKGAFIHSEKAVVRVFLPVMTNFKRRHRKRKLVLRIL